MGGKPSRTSAGVSLACSLPRTTRTSAASSNSSSALTTTATAVLVTISTLRRHALAGGDGADERAGASAPSHAEATKSTRRYGAEQQVLRSVCAHRRSDGGDD